MRIIKFNRQHRYLHIAESLWVVEGKLAGEYASVLEKEFLQVTPQKRAELCINLEQVSFVDEQGAEILLSMKDEGVKLENPSPFVREVLRRRLG